MFNNLKTNLPDGIYHNRDDDFTRNFVFVGNGELKSFKDIANLPINEKAYYCPSFFPYLSDYYTDGCVFDNHFIPTSAFKFHVINGKVNTNIIQQSINIETYIDNFYEIIKQRIIEIYKNHEHVVLSLSGGIDSLTLLSFIVNLNLLPRTTLIHYRNYFVNNHPDLTQNNKFKDSILTEIKNKFAKQYKKFIYIDIGDKNWIHVANEFSYTCLKLYATATTMLEISNCGFVSGWQGDLSLLHKTIYLETIIGEDVNKKQDYLKLLSNKKLYMNNFLKDLEKNNFVNFNCKARSWNDLSGINNNKFYVPLLVNSDLLRSLNFDSINLIDILDARVGREIIYRNVGNDFNQYISHQGNFDGDNYEKKAFSKDMFYNLDIPKNLNHNIYGYNWLNENLNFDEIETNTITSAKMLNYLNWIISV